MLRFLMTMKYPLRLVLLLAFHIPLSVSAETKPELLLANVYHPDIALADYWVSEKLDGVRAYWDGKHLLSRQGNRFNAPRWFVADFPDQQLDGELWMGRNQFEVVSGAVRKRIPVEREWRRIRFMVFDMPKHGGTFDQRAESMKKLPVTAYLKVIEQFRVASQVLLETKLDQTIALGGEGLMLHRGASYYHAGRSDDLLKFRRYQDAEARVIAYIPGSGKYKGLLGALLLETPQGMQFAVGTGFTDAVRRNPPYLGSVVTYKFFGKTVNGVPRFASFLRVREGLSPVDIEWRFQRRNHLTQPLTADEI
ncbi:MAG TPA: DNA ligase [Pseudomonadales bacterium]|nr:DNA ligase [Pseudomonadales bacterium]